MSGQDFEQLMLFPADSPASRFPQPGSEEARKMTVTSGLRCLELSRKSGPLGSLEKMLLGSSQWRSTRCYLTWKGRATKQGRLYFRLVPSMPRTGEIERASWAGKENRPIYFIPTPRAGSKSAEHDLKHGNLKGAVMYATPQARDYRTGQRERWRNPARSRNLNDQVAAMYPTPTTGAGLCGGTGNYQQLKALEVSGQITEEERRSMAAGNGGQLNPEWVEWLMEFPLGWTDLNASETP